MPSQAALYVAMADAQTVLKHLSEGATLVQIKFTSQENADAFAEVVTALSLPLSKPGKAPLARRRAMAEILTHLRVLAEGKAVVRKDFANVATSAPYADVAMRLITALESMKGTLH